MTVRLEYMNADDVAVDYVNELDRLSVDAPVEEAEDRMVLVFGNEFDSTRVVMTGTPEELRAFAVNIISVIAVREAT